VLIQSAQGLESLQQTQQVIILCLMMVTAIITRRTFMLQICAMKAVSVMVQNIV
jgi:hypothetical protein